MEVLGLKTGRGAQSGESWAGVEVLEAPTPATVSRGARRGGRNPASSRLMGVSWLQLVVGWGLGAPQHTTY
jgi:hypothetical protein